MRRLVFVILVSSVLMSIAFIQKENISAVKASPDVHQGDLILNGNNVTTIKDRRLDINGSIIVEENATLILRDAVLNFLPVESYESNMTFRNPANGNPRLIVENATIATDNAYYQRVHFYGNSSASINKLTTIGKISLQQYDSSVVSISNSTAYFIDFQGDSSADISNSVFSKGSLTYDSSTLNIFNCTLGYLYVGETSSVDMSNCTIYRDVLSEAVSANCSINELESGFVGYWDFKLNCSVQIAPGGSACNFTLTDTEIGGWSFNFAGSSNVTISNSELYDIRPDGSSVVWVYDSSFSNVMNSRGSSSTHIYNSTINNLSCHGSPRVWLVNSTSSNYNIHDQSEVYVYWYLDVHVVDSGNTDIPSANVTATYPNATVAESQLTDVNGRAKLALMEKMMNATDEYPVGKYTVEATYLTYSNSTIVNMTGNLHITMKFVDFIISEFPSLLILPLFMTATLVAVIVYRRKRVRA